MEWVGVLILVKAGKYVPGVNLKVEGRSPVGIIPPFFYAAPSPSVKSPEPPPPPYRETVTGLLPPPPFRIAPDW